MKRPAGINVEVELHSQVKSAASLRGMKLEAAYDAALRQWLGKVEPMEWSPANAKYHAMLERVLTNSDEAGRALVRLVLEIQSSLLGPQRL